MPYVTRNGLRLYYERAGNGDPPLLFVHGWCCDHTIYRTQFDHFRSTHTVIAPDLRGCGRSDRPAGGHDVTTLADDLAWLCADIGVAPPIVIGHSLGALIAIEYAARHPSMVRAVIADEPGPIDPLPSTRTVLADFVARMRGPDGEAARRAWIEDGVESTGGPDRRRWIVDMVCAVPLPIAAAEIDGAVQWDGVAALKSCAVPLLVLRCTTGGSNDAARLLAHKADTHFGVTVGTGHFHQLDAAEQVTPMMERFIDVVVPRQ